MGRIPWPSHQDVFRVQQVFPSEIISVTSRKKKNLFYSFKCNICPMFTWWVLLHSLLFAASVFASHALHPFLATQEKAGGTGYFLKVLAVEGTWSLQYAKLPSEDSGFKWLFHTLGSSVLEWCSIGEVPHSVNQIVLHLCNPDLKTRYFRANHCFCSSAVHGAFTFTYEHLVCIMS